MSAITARELAARTRAAALGRIDAATAAMFLGYWIEHGLVEEVLPGRYALTANGWRAAHGLLGSGRKGERQAP